MPEVLTEALEQQLQEYRRDHSQSRAYNAEVLIGTCVRVCFRDMRHHDLFTDKGYVGTDFGFTDDNALADVIQETLALSDIPTKRIRT